jgi:hypothetical protein
MGKHGKREGGGGLGGILKRMDKKVARSTQSDHELQTQKNFTRAKHQTDTLRGETRREAKSILENQQDWQTRLAQGLASTSSTDGGTAVDFVAPQAVATQSTGGLMTLAQTQERRKAEADRGVLEALLVENRVLETRAEAEAQAREEQEERAVEEARVATVKKKADRKDRKRREADRSKLTFTFQDDDT